MFKTRNVVPRLKGLVKGCSKPTNIRNYEAETVLNMSVKCEAISSVYIYCFYPRGCLLFMGAFVKVP